MHHPDLPWETGAHVDANDFLSPHPQLPPDPAQGRMTMPKGSEGIFSWETLVPHIVHPLKVAIIEALLWIDQPLSASDLSKIFGREYSLALASYHLNELAKIEALAVVRRRRVRGAQEKFYFFANGSAPNSFGSQWQRTQLS